MRLPIILLLGVAAIHVAGHAAPLTQPAARATAEPFTETRFGTTVNDPYRWMEDPTRHDAMAGFIRAASDDARAQLGAMPGRAAILATLEAATRAGTRYSDVRQAGGLTFYRQLDAADRVARLMARRGDGAARTLYDPKSEPANTAGPASINSYSVSPDGGTVAVHVSFGGAEVGDIRFLDSATGRERATRFGPVWGEFRVGWLDGGKVAITRMAAAAAGADPMQGMVALVGTPGGAFEPVLGPGVGSAPDFPATAFPIAQSTTLSPWVAGYAANAGGDPILYLARRADLSAGRPAWRTVARPADQLTGYALLGDELFIVATRDAPTGQLTRRAAAGGAATVVPLPAGLVLVDLAATRDGLYVVAQADGASRLLFLPGGRGPARAIALPFESEINGLEVTGDGAALTMTLAGWTRAPSSYRAVAGKLQSLGLDSASWAGAADLVVRRDEATSADGTKVPMVVITPPGSGPRAALLEGYGSYGIPTTTPWYNAPLLVWSARGNAIAYCGTRGGNERGRAWHDAGRQANKVNAHADYIACAERLVQMGVARPGAIAAMGTSAGGLLAPPSALKRPDLFGALLSRVAITNPTRLEASANGANQYGEMGDPRTEAGWRGLAAQDAYAMAETAADMPDTLITIGLNDRRVAPWMGAKLAARAIERFGGRRLILVRTDAQAGHGVGSARDIQNAEFADSFVFLEDRLKR